MDVVPEEFAGQDEHADVTNGAKVYKLVQFIFHKTGMDKKDV